VSNTTGRTARANHPAHEKALVGLWLAIDACHDFLDAHRATLPGPDHPCPRASGGCCEVCSLRDLYADLGGILYTLELYAGRLEDQARPFPEQLERLAQEWRDHDAPQAEQVLRALERVGEHGTARNPGPRPSPDRVWASDLHR
jgi:hypothetical protein